MENFNPVSSPAYFRYVDPASLQHRFFFRKEAKSFDVTQTMPSHHALNYSWGEHCNPILEMTQVTGPFSYSPINLLFNDCVITHKAVIVECY